MGDGDLDMSRNERATLHTKLALSLGAATIVAMAMFAAEAKAQTSGEVPNLEARVEPLRPGVTDSQVLAELATHNSALGNKPPNRSYR